MDDTAILREKFKELELLEAVEAKRKRERGIDYYVPNAMQFKAHKSKAKTIIFCGGNRCLGKETKIYDPVLGKEREVGSIDSEFHVLAYDGVGLRITNAEKPFKKTIDKLYEVKLSNGGKFTASMSHVVLTPFGFRTISDVQVGSELYLPQTILEPFQSTRDEDGQSSYRKVEGSLSDYRSLLRLCDGLLQREEGNAQGVFPLQDDAQEHTSFSVSSHKGGQSNTLNYTQSYQPTLHLSSSCDLFHPLVLHGDTSAYISCTTSKPSDWHISTGPKSIDGSYLEESKSLTVQHPNLSYSNSPCSTSSVVVTSIVYVRDDYKWDFTVPVYHNYFASGAIHHNSGKSTFGAVELAWHLTRKYPDWFPRERKFKKPIKAVVVCDANQKIEKVIEPKIREYLPPDYITHVKRVSGQFLSRIVCEDGSSVDFLSSEQDQMAFEGADFDFYWGDEPQKKRQFDAIMRGMIDRGGRTVLTFTPLIEPWMKEELIDVADGIRVEAFIVDMRDNKFDIKGNPILTEENILEYTKFWDEDTIQTRMHGKFFHLRGQVYSEFSEVHQVEFEYQYPDPVIAVLDPHDRQPHHVIWAIVDRIGDLFIHSEISVHCTVQDLAKLVKKIESDNGYRMRRRLIDPNFGRSPLITTGRNFIQEMAVAGCGGWFEANDKKEEGRLKVKEYLHFDKTKPISFTNKPKLFFHKSRCPLTIKSIRNHQYEEWVGKIASERDPKEKSKDKETHGADCVRYLCMSNPTFGRMEEEAYELEAAPY